ncbi:hypothetical protein GUITHDRAFT_120520 [Guillardia theta CCMP2712]|uniref:RWP-RK domain-containing protein n=1 Tax=Guillardia theta (strain CCMP2712) TaxID=905079 RepID=L1IAP1_GUITC|nr:hypothetical protein GUITHDRAFT_120520 [Guillardia theta CCMP2712]EKX33306.1 hypothetical protein GUITHDRAFT_120520 [Guillardia theta CCMP2712]|eukprot:XP_005820286.1 hypothetical protein GUITHDRAFT_120520 [Guillardia theta CCMP2712]
MEMDAKESNGQTYGACSFKSLLISTVQKGNTNKAMHRNLRSRNTVENPNQGLIPSKATKTKVFPRRKRGEKERNSQKSLVLGLNDIKNMFHMRQTEAAAFLGISLTAMKNACRRVGVSRWPYSRHRPRRVSLKTQTSSHVHVKSTIVKAEPATAKSCSDEASRDEMWENDEALDLQLLSNDTSLDELLGVEESESLHSTPFDPDDHDAYTSAGEGVDLDDDSSNARIKWRGCVEEQEECCPEDIVHYLHAPGQETLADWRDAFRDTSNDSEDLERRFYEDAFPTIV